MISNINIDDKPLALRQIEQYASEIRLLKRNFIIFGKQYIPINEQAREEVMQFIKDLQLNSQTKKYSQFKR